jgi:hypothetical protein
MSGPCEQCRHYRPKRHLSELLALTWSERTAQEIDRIMDNEREIEKGEAAMRVALMQKGCSQWVSKPMVSAYCGLEEERGVHLIHQMKNRPSASGDYTCPAHEPEGLPASRPCSTCQHYVAPTGPQQDAAVLRDILDPSQNSYSSSPDSASTIKGNVDRHLSGVETRKSMEMKAAMHGGGKLFSLPMYYPHCRKYSTPPGCYVLCQIQNPINQCPGWSPGGAAQGGSESGWGW